MTRHEFEAISSRVHTAGRRENLRDLPKTVAGQIIRKISRLESGLTGNIKRLRPADFGYRLCMGDYRILFDVEDDTIIIQTIGHRKDVYE